ncbi:MAG TPA: M1 family aminopeptidase [Chitinophagales bacterium]|nr:M1 family aminopeptidase [Chitinophagales bacterium]
MKLKATLLAFGLLLGLSTFADDLRGDTLDVHSYLLRLDFTNFSTKVLYADATIGIKAKMANVHGIHLDLLKLTVDSVQVNGTSSQFFYNDSLLDIGFATPLNINDSATLRIFYHGHPIQMSGDFGGFYWNGLYAFNIGVSFLADPHCYGRVWLPCFDNFETRSYYEYFVTTKNTQKAFCNGLLLDSITGTNSIIWHWKLSRNIPSYLASVAVSDYQTLSDTVHAANGTLPVLLAARATDTASLAYNFRHLHNAFHILENLWGPYQWNRVGYCIVPFTAGAMEHATNISFMEYYLTLIPDECEETMAHELSHHWFGDLVTCDKAEEMWLNEGWAVYNQKLFEEYCYGEYRYRSGIDSNHLFVLQQVANDDKAWMPVGNVPSGQTYSQTVYYKGADMMHTLRYYMGDSLFFHCLKNYLSLYSGNNGSITILSTFLSQCSNINLTDYFNDWVLSPGFTHFSIEKTIIQPLGNSEVKAEVFIRQRLSHADHFYNNVPVVVSYFDANRNRFDEVVNVSGQCSYHEHTFSNFTPVYIALDYDRHLQDAITDEWKVIVDTGTYIYNTALLNVKVNNVPDSAIVRVEQSWLPAEPMFHPIPSLHLNNRRYWTIDGTFDSTFNASATFTYNGNTNAYLDSSFISNSEDSLVVMYRANEDSDWALADSFTINIGNSASDKTGTAAIYNIRKGMYTLAIYNSQYPVDTNTFVSCPVETAIPSVQNGAGFKMFPNPAAETTTLVFAAGTFAKCGLFDLSGRKIYEIKIMPQQTTADIKLKTLSTGNYFVTLTTNNGYRITKKLVKE